MCGIHTCLPWVVKHQYSQNVHILRIENSIHIAIINQNCVLFVMGNKVLIIYFRYGKQGNWGSQIFAISIGGGGVWTTSYVARKIFKLSAWLLLIGGMTWDWPRSPWIDPIPSHWVSRVITTSPQFARVGPNHLRWARRVYPELLLSYVYNKCIILLYIIIKTMSASCDYLWQRSPSSCLWMYAEVWRPSVSTQL